MSTLYISLGAAGVVVCAVVGYAAWRLYKWVSDEDDDDDGYEDDYGYEDEEDSE